MLNIVQFYFRVLAQLPAIRSSKLFLAFLFAESNKFTFAYWVLIYLFWIVISKCKGIGEGGSCKNNFNKRLNGCVKTNPRWKSLIILHTVTIYSGIAMRFLVSCVCTNFGLLGWVRFYSWAVLCDNNFSNWGRVWKLY